MRVCAHICNEDACIWERLHTCVQASVSLQLDGYSLEGLLSVPEVLPGVGQPGGSTPSDAHSRGGRMTLKN